MPIKVHAQLRRPSQEEFAQISYEVMNCVFAIHNEIGRFFDERIYKREMARRLGEVELEVPIEVSFRTFRKFYFLDVLVRQSGVFEFKAQERIGPKDQGQLLNYLLLSELPHGKLINLRPDKVEHEFVNTTLRLGDRINFTVEDRDFSILHDELRWKEWLVGAVREWGTGLDLQLYEDVLIHALGGESQVTQDVEVVIQGCSLATQKVRMCGPGIAFKITALTEGQEAFENHARRFLAHTRLPAIQWLNLTRSTLTFRTLRP